MGEVSRMPARYKNAYPGLHKPQVMATKIFMVAPRIVYVLSLRF
jgi:hypothetical protein